VTPHDQRGDREAKLGHSGRLRWKARFERIRARWTATSDKARSIVPALDLLWRFGSQYRRLNGSVLVGHLTYRFFLWFAPFLLVLVALLGYGAAAQLWVAKYLDEAGLEADFTTSVSEQAQASRLYLLVFGSFALLYTTWGLLRAMHYAYAQVWEVEIRPPRGITRAIGFLLLGAAVATLVAMIVSWLRAGGLLLRLGGSTTALVALVAIVLLLSRTLPRRSDSLFDLLPGAILAGVALFLMQLFAQLWLPRKVESSSDLYGSLGAVFATLLYLWLIATTLVGSAFVNAVWTDRHAILAGRPLLTDPDQLPEWMRGPARRLVDLVGRHSTSSSDDPPRRRD
jgi:uncharacterized BrkB/YihY/UPF0761 family membrane protein